MEESGTNDQGAIRELIDRYVNAVRAKDIGALMSVYAADLVAFDLVPPLRYGDAEAFRRVWQEVFETFQGPIPYEVHDLKITVGDDVAFSHSLNRNNGTMKSGQKADLWLRWTVGYRKTNGVWRIAHVHVSVPVDPRTGMAALDLKP